MRAAAAFACGCAAATLAAKDIQETSIWTCLSLNSSSLAQGAAWQRLNCSSPGVPVFGAAGPVVINIVTADLSQPNLRLVPAIANQSAWPPLASLNAIAATDGRNLIAGINGGYFYRVDVSTFNDGVCQGKSAANASAPPSQATPNTGVGDAVTISDGQWLSSNCNLTGFNRPVVLTMNGTNSRIDLVPQGGPPPFGLEFDALGAGPLLLASNATGTFVAIPSDDQNWPNVLEHSANTALGLLPNGTAVFVTFDGWDSCAFWDPTCGTNAFTMAYFLRDYLGAVSAMGMDQGGSTTMYVAGHGADGIVTCTSQGSGCGSPRNIFNGLFLELLE